MAAGASAGDCLNQAKVSFLWAYPKGHTNRRIPRIRMRMKKKKKMMMMNMIMMIRRPVCVFAIVEDILSGIIRFMSSFWDSLRVVAP